MIVMMAGFLGAVSIALGAYGSHGLKERVDERTYHSFSNAVRYHQLHTVVILVLGLITETQILSDGIELLLQIAAWGMITAVLLFSGSIYLAVFTGNRSFGKITPAGGLTFIAAWLILAITGFYG